MMNCKACPKRLDANEMLCCSSCRDTYHYGCLNIGSAEYMRGNYELRRKFQCHHCQNVTRRKRNEDTPVRGHVKLLQVEELKKPNDEQVEQPRTQGRTKSPPPPPAPVTIEQISNLLESMKSILTTEMHNNKKDITINYSDR